MIATILKTVAKITGAELLKLAKETAEKAMNLGANIEAVSKGSEEIALAWLPVYDILPNFKTGKADVKSFVQKIYENFPPEMLVAKEGNPNVFKTFGTVDKDGPAKSSPECVRVARAMRAVEKWLEAHIDGLIYEEVEKLDETGAPIIVDGVPAVQKVPKFQKIVNNEEKALNKLLGSFNQILQSDLLTADEKTALTPVFTLISSRLAPTLADAKKAHEAATEALKAGYVAPVDATDETAEKAA